MGADRLGPGGKPKRGNESGMEDKEIERHTTEMVRTKSSGERKLDSMQNLTPERPMTLLIARRVLVTEGSAEHGVIHDS